MTTSITCKSNSEKALIPIKVLGALCNSTIDYKVDEKVSTLELTIEQTSPFTKETVRIAKETGYKDVVSGITEVSMYCNGDSDNWMELVQDMSIWVYGDVAKSADELKSVLSKVGTHLASQSYLSSTSISGIDVVVCFVLIAALEKVGGGIEDEATMKWLTSIVTNQFVIDTIGNIQIPTSTASRSSDDDMKVEQTEADIDNEVIQKLSSLDICHDTYSHVECNTCDDLQNNVPLPTSSSSSSTSSSTKETHTKNLFLKDKKHGMFLVTVSPSSSVNTKELGKALKLQGKVNLRFADEKTLWDNLKVKPGCVGPLSILNDASNKVTLVLDKSLLDMDKIHSHPLLNTFSTSLTPQDLLNYIKECAHEPIILSFEPSSSSASSQPSASASNGKAPANHPPSSKKQSSTKTSASSQSNNTQDKKSTKKGETLLRLQWSKKENFPAWYSDLIVLSEMISYYDISGCYILRPWSFKIWELIQRWFNTQLEPMKVENSYFPLFVSADRLEKEKDHVEGFAPEVAWVTKSGEDQLAKPIAIRPTSETIMYPAFSDWIRSHRDLPLKLNQWSNVVRWEFKDPTPFLRSREFLWQEGHTAHATFEEAQLMVRQALELYRGVYEDLLAVPVIPGYKTEKEKFAGGYRTTTVEAYIPGSGRAIQGATSHNLGQNFGKMFDINYQDESGKNQIVWQTSWGLTTRTIGVMVMVHGDDQGLVLPPRVSPLQVVIIPIISKKVTFDDVSPYCMAIYQTLLDIGIRVKYDDRELYNPGWKYNHWEQKGVPIRIEVGPRDIKANQCRIVIRHSNEKLDVSVDTLSSTIPAQLETIQKQMFEKAKKERDAHLVQVTDWKDFVPNLELNNLVMTPWCGPEHTDWEEWVKKTSREESLVLRNQSEEEETTATSVAAKTLCIPFDQPEMEKGMKCIASGLEATCWCVWGRSY